MKLKDLKVGDYFKFTDPVYPSLYVVCDDHGVKRTFSLTNNRIHEYDRYLEWEVVRMYFNMEYAIWE